MYMIHSIITTLPNVKLSNCVNQSVQAKTYLLQIVNNKQLPTVNVSLVEKLKSMSHDHRGKTSLILVTL